MLEIDNAIKTIIMRRATLDTNFIELCIIFHVEEKYSLFLRTDIKKNYIVWISCDLN